MPKGGGRGNGAPTDSAVGAAAVAPGASALTNGPTRALWVGGAGNVDLTFVDGSTVTLSGVPAGTLLPVQVTHVTGGTTATLIIALY